MIKGFLKHAYEEGKQKAYPEGDFFLQELTMVLLWGKSLAHMQPGSYTLPLPTLTLFVSWWKVDHIKCHFNTILLKWEWVLNPAKTKSALMQAYTPSSS